VLAHPEPIAPDNDDVAVVHEPVDEGAGHDVVAEAKAAAAQALALDGELADAHCTVGYGKVVYEFDWAGAELAFKRALELSPNHSDAYDLYGRLCASLDRHDEAIALYRRAQELDPLAHRVDVASGLLRAGRYEEAVAAARQAVEVDREHTRAHSTLGWALLRVGRKAEGLAELERATMRVAQLGQAYAQAGEIDRARDVLQRLIEQSRTSYVAPYHMAYIYTGLGQHEQAVDCLEQAVEQRAGAVYGMKGSFLFTPLHPHPRFQALLQRMHLA
jgi:tetratricopeptide (TPR) repeat protein